MLRFFRLIRRKLIEEDRVRTYFYYAVGEILLVMIVIFKNCPVRDCLLVESMRPTCNCAVGTIYG